MPSNYEKAYEQIRPWLNDLPAPVEIEFLGRRWRAAPDGIQQLSGPPANINCKSVLVWYLTQAGEGEPSYEFTPLHSFTHGIFRSNSWEGGTDATLESFRLACQRLGASFVRSEPYSEVWLLIALPKLPVLMSYIQADDEFPAAIDLKYGANATQFLPFETLAVLNSLIKSEFRLRNAGSDQID
ncbi:MAG: DUF3786 domain-containing protein [Eubacteriaceae bacterium]|jgi:hypothetical protein|nr:DUF3786 domain-containing protein [Eubacteriaceae bacterium]